MSNNVNLSQEQISTLGNLNNFLQSLLAQNNQTQGPITSTPLPISGTQRSERVRSGDLLDSALGALPCNSTSDTSFSASDRSFGSSSSQQNRSYQSFEPAGAQSSSRPADHHFQSNNRTIHRNDQASQRRRPYSRPNFGMPPSTEFMLNIKLMLPKELNVDFDRYLAKDCGQFSIQVKVSTDKRLEDIRIDILNAVAALASHANSDRANLRNYAYWNLQFLQKTSEYLLKWEDITVTELFKAHKNKTIYIGLQLLDVENDGASNALASDDPAVSDSNSINQENMEPSTPPARFKKFLNAFQTIHNRELKGLKDQLDGMEKKMRKMVRDEVDGLNVNIVKQGRNIADLGRKIKKQGILIELALKELDTLKEGFRNFTGRFRKLERYL